MNEVIIDNNIFFGNLAMEGGAIKWIESEPSKLDSNNFNSNKAIYGQNIAAFPLKISLIIRQQNPNSSISDNFSQMLNLKELQSGDYSSYLLNFQIIDHYNQTVVSLTGEYSYFLI